SLAQWRQRNSEKRFCRLHLYDHRRQRNYREVSAAACRVVHREGLLSHTPTLDVRLKLAPEECSTYGKFAAAMLFCHNFPRIFGRISPFGRRKSNPTTRRLHGAPGRLGSAAERITR